VVDGISDINRGRVVAIAELGSEDQDLFHPATLTAAHGGLVAAR
jgi:hypothetical protein